MYVGEGMGCAACSKKNQICMVIGGVIPCIWLAGAGCRLNLFLVRDQILPQAT